MPNISKHEIIGEYFLKCECEEFQNTFYKWQGWNVGKNCFLMMPISYFTKKGNVHTCTHIHLFARYGNGSVCGKDGLVLFYQKRQVPHSHVITCTNTCSTFQNCSGIVWENGLGAEMVFYNGRYWKWGSKWKTLLTNNGDSRGHWSPLLICRILPAEQVSWLCMSLECTWNELGMGSEYLTYLECTWNVLGILKMNSEWAQTGGGV